MQKTPSRKAHHASAKPDGESTGNVQSQSGSATKARQVRRKSLAAFIMSIPPGDPRDEQDFARVQ